VKSGGWRLQGASAQCAVAYYSIPEAMMKGILRTDKYLVTVKDGSNRGDTAMLAQQVNFE
jgi:hypothetical protein